MLQRLFLDKDRMWFRFVMWSWKWKLWLQWNLVEKKMQGLYFKVVWQLLRTHVNIAPLVQKFVANYRRDLNGSFLGTWCQDTVEWLSSWRRIERVPPPSSNPPLQFLYICVARSESTAVTISPCARCVGQNQKHNINVCNKHVLQPHTILKSFPQDVVEHIA